MLFEDGSAQTFAAIRLLESQKDALGCPHLKLQTVPEFLELAGTCALTGHDKDALVGQAILLIDQFYAHLPYKRARYATDPVQHFRLIRAQLDQLPDDLAFHDQMIRAFMRMRDAHTFYGLPEPYRGALAFLPFRIDCYYESGQRRYLVIDVMEGFEHAHFGVGAEVTLWGGMTVERAVEREGEQEPGGNRDARFVRGLRRLTKRSLTFSTPPDERFEVIQYVPAAGGPECSIVLPWIVVSALMPSAQGAGSTSSLNESMAELKILGEMLWKREHFAKRKTAAPLTAGGNLYESKYPHVFEFQDSRQPANADSASPGALFDPAHPDQKFGYIRIKTFDLDSEEFIAEFERVVDHMREAAPDGLILDVRSNPGGSIDAAERILQMLTPTQIQPANFHFINSTLMQEIAAKLKAESSEGALNADWLEWMPWIDDLLASVNSAEFVTPGRPLTSPDQVNDTGQRYQGPVTLIVDASSYSATDIFAAGFQDHAIGVVIGVDAKTGGGGANRWLHEDIRRKLEGISPEIPLKPLPRNAQMGLAIRRSSRVGANAGTFLEDEGVQSDLQYRLTRNDILNDDWDLLRFACGQLGALPARTLKIVKAELLDRDGIGLIVQTRNLDRIECFADGWPQCSFTLVDAHPTVDGVRVFLVPTAGLIDLPASQLRVDGYAKIMSPSGVEQLRLVAQATAELESAPSGADPAFLLANKATA